MLDYLITKPGGILRLSPTAPLSKKDFSGLSAEVDAYLCENAKLHGVLIHAKAFPGWEDFGSFTAHLHFIRDHHQQIERIAVVTDSPLAGIAELLGKHFTSADIRHFPFADDNKALEWLEAV